MAKKQEKKTHKTKGKVSGWFRSYWKCAVAAVCALLCLSGVAFLCWCKGPGDLHKVQFGYESGFYSGDIEVGLSVDWIIVPGLTKIRYTLNGDEPGVSGKVYDSKIKLEVPESGYKVYTITAAYCYFGSKCGDESIGTYVLGKNLGGDVDLDIISITASQKDLYDYDTGIMVKGKIYDENEGVDQSEYAEGNYSQRGEEWIRDAHVTMFGVAGGVVIDQNLGLQISGGASAALEVKSLKLVGNKKYGYEKIKFDFGDSFGVQKYNSLRLMLGQDYAAGNNVRSSVASRLAEESGFAGHSATKRAVVYLNGSYYGTADVQQNYSDSFFTKKFGLSDSDKTEKSKGGEYEVLEYFGVKELFRADLDKEENRDNLERRVDMEDYLLYYALMVLWDRNTWDWPRSNYEAWRYNGPEISGNKYADGRLRFLIYDVDKIFWDYTAATLDSSYTLRNLLNGTGQAEENVFKNVMKSKYYRSKFLSVVDKLMAGPLKTEHVLEVYDAEVDRIRKQTELHYSAHQYILWERWVELMREKILWYNDVLKGDLEELREW